MLYFLFFFITVSENVIDTVEIEFEMDDAVEKTSSNESGEKIPNIIQNKKLFVV